MLKSLLTSFIFIYLTSLGHATVVDRTSLFSSLQNKNQGKIEELIGLYSNPNNIGFTKEKQESLIQHLENPKALTNLFVFLESKLFHRGIRDFHIAESILIDIQQLQEEQKTWKSLLQGLNHLPTHDSFIKVLRFYSRTQSLLESDMIHPDVIHSLQELRKQTLQIYLVPNSLSIGNAWRLGNADLEKHRKLMDQIAANPRIYVEFIKILGSSLKGTPEHKRLAQQALNRLYSEYFIRRTKQGPKTFLPKVLHAQFAFNLDSKYQTQNKGYHFDLEHSLVVPKGLDSPWPFQDIIENSLHSEMKTFLLNRIAKHILESVKDSKKSKPLLGWIELLLQGAQLNSSTAKLVTEVAKKHASELKSSLKWKIRSYQVRSSFSGTCKRMLGD